MQDGGARGGDAGKKGRRSRTGIRGALAVRRAGSRKFTAALRSLPPWRAFAITADHHAGS